MQGTVKRFLIVTLAGATIATGVGAAAISAAADARPAGQNVRTSDVRHEAEARGRVAEGEREAGDDRGDDAENEAEHEAEHEAENEAGDDRGPSGNSGPSDNRGPGGHGSDDGQGDDRGSGR
jgi:hypothetical protein